MVEMSERKHIDYDPDRPLQEQLAQFADAKVEILRDPNWVGFMRVAMGVMVRDPETARASLAEAKKQDDYLVLWLRAAHKDGRLTIPDAKLASEVFWSAVGGAFFWPVVMGTAPRGKARIKLRDEIVRGFVEAYGG